MAFTYELFNGNMTILFDRFRRCLGRSARTDWDNVVAGMAATQVNLQNVIFAMFARVLGEDAEDNLFGTNQETKDHEGEGLGKKSLPPQHLP